MNVVVVADGVGIIVNLLPAELRIFLCIVTGQCLMPNNVTLSIVKQIGHFAGLKLLLFHNRAVINATRSRAVRYDAVCITVRYSTRTVGYVFITSAVANDISVTSARSINC